MARTPLFSSLRKAALSAYKEISRNDLRTTEARHTLTRRSFLKGVGSATGALAVARLDSLTEFVASSSRKPRIVIVGAGIAGLNTAFRLSQAGHRAEIYEAAPRTGGRIMTARGVMGDNLTTELGGEFIDSSHADMLRLVATFGLQLVDVDGPSERSLRKEAYFFNGRHYSNEEAITEFVQVLRSLQRDLAATPDIVDFQNTNRRATVLDNTSIAEYLDSLGSSDWFRALLNVAYETEYGLSTVNQSTFNLLYLILPDPVNRRDFQIFGESDERYKIVGGNDRVIAGLTGSLLPQISLGHTLEAIDRRGSRYVLSFSTGGGSKEVLADFVILALPFTLLRTVAIRVRLPRAKRLAIDTLGYGTNAKVFAGFNTAIWREQGHSGNAFTDLSFQSGWDSSRLQGSSQASFTFYLGGQTGVTATTRTAAANAAQFIPELDVLFPGSSSLHNGRTSAFYWPTYQLTRGSYACYLPGQWTSIAGAESIPVGNIFFAGEHCSIDFQGFMNGGAQSGRLAARAILLALRLKRALTA